MRIKIKNRIETNERKKLWETFAVMLKVAKECSHLLETLKTVKLSQCLDRIFQIARATRRTKVCSGLMRTISTLRSLVMEMERVAKAIQTTK